MNGSNDRVLSIAHLTLADCTPPEQVSAAAEAGFRWISLNRGGGARPSLVEDAALLKETQHRLADTGLRVNDLEGISLTRDLDIKGLAPVFEVTASLGAKGFTVTGRDDDHSFLTEAFAEVCRIAAPYGVEPNFEFFRFSSVRNLAETLAIVRGAKQPNGRVLIDTLHIGRSHVSIDEVKAVEPALIRYIQFCDCVLEEEPADTEGLRDEAIFNRLLPGDGTLPLVDILHALPANVGVSIEAPNRAEMTLPPAQRAKRAYDAAMRVLQAAAG
jgi:sugar phosphate isomerase/epimerase